MCYWLPFVKIQYILKHNTNFIFIHLFDIFEESRPCRDFSFYLKAAIVGLNRKMLLKEMGTEVDSEKSVVFSSPCPVKK